MAADDGFQGKKQVGCGSGEAWVLGTGSGRGGGIVYQGRDTVRRAGRGQGRAEVSRGVSDEVSGVKFGRGVSEKKGGCVLGREIADNCRGGERRG